MARFVLSLVIVFSSFTTLTAQEKGGIEVVLKGMEGKLPVRIVVTHKAGNFSFASFEPKKPIPPGSTVEVRSNRFSFTQHSIATLVSGKKKTGLGPGPKFEVGGKDGDQLIIVIGGQEPHPAAVIGEVAGVPVLYGLANFSPTHNIGKRGDGMAFEGDEGGPNSYVCRRWYKLSHIHKTLAHDLVTPPKGRGHDVRRFHHNLEFGYPFTDGFLSMTVSDWEGELKWLDARLMKKVVGKLEGKPVTIGEYYELFDKKPEAENPLSVWLKNFREVRAARNAAARQK